jgi:hypothetical protein
MKKFCVALVFALLILGAASFAAEDQYSNLSFVVTKDDGGRPVRNAAVILHTVDKDGKQQRGGMELKTDADGKTSMNSIPYGKLRVQVIARGLQTYGEDYDINQPTHTFEIKLKPPQKQYSIYDKK